MAENLQDQIQVTTLEKMFDAEVARRSVVETPPAAQRQVPISPLIMTTASVADDIAPWGSGISRRDLQLRQFWPTEPFLASAVYGTSVRNASFEWEVVNVDPRQPPHVRTIRAVETMLKQSDRGAGWEQFITKISEDNATQDNGAFIEIIRAEDDPFSPVINLAHIDAWRCTRTGDPERPVLYRNDKGQERLLWWYQVQTLEEFPSTIETMYNAQICAVSRALRAAQIIRDIAIYKREKISGRFAGAIHIVGGISQSELDDMVAWHEENMNNRGLIRYSAPIMVAGIDPTHAVSHEQIDYASLPENFDEETTFKWYVTQLALAFGVDYQEFAPLPSGNIGSSMQSEILHAKTRGKGPAVIMKKIEHILNNSGILPRTVKFQYKLQDIRAEAEKAGAQFDRGKDRALRVRSGELDVDAAIDIAEEAGDTPPHIAERMRDRRAKMEQQGPPPPQPATNMGEQAITNTQSGNSEFGVEQIASGVNSELGAAFQKATLNRVEALAELQHSGRIVGLNLPQVSDEVLAEARLRVRKRLAKLNGKS